MNLILNFSHKVHKVPKVDILYVAPADFRSRDGTLDLVGEGGTIPLKFSNIFHVYGENIA